MIGDPLFSIGPADEATFLPIVSLLQELHEGGTTGVAVEKDNSMVSEPEKAGKEQLVLSYPTHRDFGNLGKPQSQDMLTTVQSHGAEEPRLKHPPGLLNIDIGSAVKVENARVRCLGIAHIGKVREYLSDIRAIL